MNDTDDDASVIIAPETYRVSDMIEAMSAGSDMKKADAKAALEALGRGLAEALAAGRTVKWNALGIVKPVGQKETPSGTLVRCRVKLAGTKKG